MLMKYINVIYQKRIPHSISIFGPKENCERSLENMSFSLQDNRFFLAIDKFYNFQEILNR